MKKIDVTSSLYPYKKHFMILKKYFTILIKKYVKLKPRYILQLSKIQKECIIDDKSINVS